MGEVAAAWRDRAIRGSMLLAKSRESKLYSVSSLAIVNYHVGFFLLGAVAVGFFLLPKLANSV